MRVDGKAIAADILASVQADVSAFSRAPTLTAVTCAPNFETKQYLEMKKRKAASVGISLNVVELLETVSTAEAITCVERVAKASDGVVVQLPLPSHLEKDAVLTAVPAGKDPDGFSYTGTNDSCIPPVVGAIDEISRRHDLQWEGKRVVILGHGRLVGQPAALYATARGAHTTVLTETNFAPAELQQADIIVTGIGQPRFVTPNLVQAGVVVFDAGTSEDGGVLVGDVDPAVLDKATLMTPVPGGIGPITIAYLLKNLVALAAR